MAVFLGSGVQGADVQRANLRAPSNPRSSHLDLASVVNDEKRPFDDDAVSPPLLLLLVVVFVVVMAVD